METTREQLILKQINAAIHSQDQLVFVYRRGENDLVVRFVTPIDIRKSKANKTMVRCAQHLPEEGYRNFFLEKIEAFHRVISRDAFVNSGFMKKDVTQLATVVS